MPINGVNSSTTILSGQIDNGGASESVGVPSSGESVGSNGTVAVPLRTILAQSLPRLGEHDGTAQVSTDSPQNLSPETKDSLNDRTSFTQKIHQLQDSLSGTDPEAMARIREELLDLEVDPKNISSDDLKAVEDLCRRVDDRLEGQQDGKSVEIKVSDTLYSSLEQSVKPGGEGVLAKSNTFSFSENANGLESLPILNQSVNDVNQIRKDAGKEAADDVRNLLGEARGMLEQPSEMARKLDEAADLLVKLKPNGPDQGPVSGEKALYSVSEQEFNALQEAYLDACRLFMKEHLGGIVEMGGNTQEAKKKGAEVENTLRLLAEKVFLAGKGIGAFTSALEAGLKANDVGSRDPKGYRADLLVVLGNYLAQSDLTDAKARSEALGVVDMVFQMAIPEFADEALSVKMALMPGYDEDVRLQHSLMLAHRRVMNELLNEGGTKANGSEKAILKSMIGSNSARSFVLTPETVEKILKSKAVRNGKMKLEEVNYLLSNLAALEMLAVKKKLLDPPSVQTNNGVEYSRISNAGEWIKALGLPEEMAQHAGNLDRWLNDENDPDRSTEAFRALVAAAEGFGKGLSGDRDLKKAAGRVQEKSGAASDEFADISEGLALNRLIADLTGLVKSEDRNVPGKGLDLNDEKVAGEMLKVTEDIKKRMDKDEGDLNRLVKDYDDFQKKAGGLRAQADILSKFASANDEVISLRKSLSEAQGRHDRFEAVKARLKFVWPHQREDRRKVADLVLEFGKIHDDLEKMIENGKALEGEEKSIHDSACETLRNELQKIRGKLTGVDFQKMLPTKGNQVPSDELILGEMRTRAEALSYFDAKIKGGLSGQAETDARELKTLAEKIRTSDKSAGRLRKSIKKAIGKKGMDDLKDIAFAALLKVCRDVGRETGRPSGTVSLRNEEVMNRFTRQMAEWGLSFDERPALRSLVEASLRHRLLPDGCVDPAAAKRIRSRYYKELKRERGLEGARQVRDGGESVREALHLGEERRVESAAAILTLADKSDGGIVYSRGRGFLVDSSSVFMPFSSPDKAFTSNPLGWNVGGSLKGLKNDSIAVRRLNGGYQVILKGGLSASVGAFAKVKSINSDVLKASGGLSGNGASGIELSFPDRASCEQFLSCAMKGTGADLKETRDAVLKASGVRFVSERGASADLSAQLMLSALKFVKVHFGIMRLNFLSPEKSLGLTGPDKSIGGQVDVGINAGAALKANTGTEVSSNARGTTVTHRTNLSATLSATLSASITGTYDKDLDNGKIESTTLDSISPDPLSMVGDLYDAPRNGVKKTMGNLLADAKSSNNKLTIGFNMTRMQKFVTDETGLSSSSSLSETYEFSAKFHGKGMVKALLDDREVRELAKKDPAFAEKLAVCLDKARPGDKITVERRLTPKALARVRAALIEARAKMDAASLDVNKQEAFEEAFAKITAPITGILDDPASYRPVKIVIKGTKNTDLTRRWTGGFGLGPIQIQNKKMLTTSVTRGELAINLGE